MQIVLNSVVFEQLTTHPAYYISSDGAIHSPANAHRGALLKGGFNSCGYKQVWIKDKEGKYKWNTVHRLQALNFIPNPNNLKEVNHKDGNKLNNSLANLEWINHADNIQHSYDNNHRKIYKGADHWNTGKKATDKQRKAMSISKLGKKHPKHIGTFITPWGTFESANQAGIAGSICPKTVLTRCKSHSFTHLGYVFKPA